MNISMKLVYQYTVIFLNFQTTSNHLHPLQGENCDSNSRLVVGEDDNGKFRLERVYASHLIYTITRTGPWSRTKKAFDIARFSFHLMVSRDAKREVQLTLYPLGYIFKISPTALGTWEKVPNICLIQEQILMFKLIFHSNNSDLVN